MKNQLFNFNPYFSLTTYKTEWLYKWTCRICNQKENITDYCKCCGSHIESADKRKNNYV